MAETFLYSRNIFCVNLQPLTTGKQVLSPRFVTGRFASSMTDKKEKKILVRQVECARHQQKTQTATTE